MSAAALAVMAGHAYPVFLKFQGRKSGGELRGRFLCLTPLPLAAILVVFVVVVAWTRHISMGSIVGAATFPLAVWLIQQPPWPVVAAAIAGGAFIIYRHSSNIQRLRAGTETRVPFRRHANREEPRDYRRRQLGHGAGHRAGAALSTRPACGSTRRTWRRAWPAPGRTTFTCPASLPDECGCY